MGNLWWIARNLGTSKKKTLAKPPATNQRGNCQRGCKLLFSDGKKYNTIPDKMLHIHIKYTYKCVYSQNTVKKGTTSMDPSHKSLATALVKKSSRRKMRQFSTNGSAPEQCGWPGSHCLANHKTNSLCWLHTNPLLLPYPP